MTTEIAIINRQGIALAADSAVTIGREKVWKTANKIFSLSPYNDIGIMVYGNSSFIGFPWETLIKIFRSNTSSSKFQTVQNCTDSLIEFLASKELSREKYENLSVLEFCKDQIASIKYLVEKEKSIIGEDGAINESNFLQKLFSILEKVKSNYKQTKMEVLKKDFESQFKTYIQECLQIEFPNQKITELITDSICSFCFEKYNRECMSTYSSGIVVTGFGNRELFPVLIDLTIDGKFKGKVRHWFNNINNLNQDDGYAGIIPFAQTDMCHLFMGGIATQFLEYLNVAISNTINERVRGLVEEYVQDQKDRLLEQSRHVEINNDLIIKFNNEFSNYRQQLFVNPVLTVITSLPKEEMAAMAEAMVELTTLRRKMGHKIESVGGPTDVAIISKGDGFIWIKRKHYFELDYNMDYERRKAIQNEGVSQ